MVTKYNIEEKNLILTVLLSSPFVYFKKYSFAILTAISIISFSILLWYKETNSFTFKFKPNEDIFLFSSIDFVKKAIELATDLIDLSISKFKIKPSVCGKKSFKSKSSISFKANVLSKFSITTSLSILKCLLFL